ncbi:MAG: FtsX-like permease family protein [Actinomycetia bacterium]|nr:FtsX-like permease family protein [Actinomycetes bacterium]
MISSRIKKIFRDLSSNLPRTMLVVLSIAVGIFATGAILGARQVLLREFESDFAQSQKASIVFSVSDVDEALIDRIARHEEVIAANGRRVRYVRLRFTQDDEQDPDAPANATTPTQDSLSSSWDSLELIALSDFDTEVNRFAPYTATAWPPRKGDVLIEYSALAVIDYQVGDLVEIDNGSDSATFRVAGFVHDINAIPTRFFRQVTAYVTLESMELIGEPPSFNSIYVRVDPELTRTEVSTVATDIKDTILYPAGITVSSTSVPNPGAHFFGDIFKAVSTLLLGMALMALALSGFLVVTTVSAILVQHTKQLGIMKAIGGRRAQIALMYFGLVFCFGLWALLIGLPSGMLFGYFFINYAADVLNFRVVDFSYPAQVVALLVGIGLILPLIAATVPVILGVRRPIVDAFNANALLPNFGEGWIDRLLSRIRFLARPTVLALRTTFTRKGRFALTLITLLLASGVVMAVFTSRASLMQTVDDIGSWWRYDAQLQLARPVPKTTIEAEALKVDGVSSVEAWMDGYSIINRPDGTKNERYFSLGFPADSQVAHFHFVQGRNFEEGEQGVILNTELFNEEDYVTLGSFIELDIAGEQIQRKVIGVVTGSLQGPTLYFERDDLAQLMGVPGSATRVFAQMDQSLTGLGQVRLFGWVVPRLDQSMGSMRAFNQQRIADELEKRFDSRGYAVSGTETSVLQLDEARGQLGILITFLIIMASALAAVGVIGLSGSMTLSVIESTREIGIMRSIGASHRSIFTIYVTQGLVVGTISWFLGALISIPLSWVLMQSLIGAIGMNLAYRYSYAGVAITLLLVWAISAVGSLLPAWRASQVSIRDAISYE